MDRKCLYVPALKQRDFWKDSPVDIHQVMLMLSCIYLLSLRESAIHFHTVAWTHYIDPVTQLYAIIIIIIIPNKLVCKGNLKEMCITTETHVYLIVLDEVWWILWTNFESFHVKIFVRIVCHQRQFYVICIYSRSAPPSLCNRYLASLCRGYIDFLTKKTKTVNPYRNSATKKPTSCQPLTGHTQKHVQTCADINYVDRAQFFSSVNIFHRLSGARMKDDITLTTCIVTIEMRTA